MPDSENPYRASIDAALEAVFAQAKSLLPAVEAARLARDLLRSEKVRQILLAKNSRVYGRIEVARALVALAAAERPRNPARMMRWLSVAIRFIYHLKVPAPLQPLRSDALGEAWCHLARGFGIAGRPQSAIRGLERAERHLCEGTGDVLLLGLLSATRAVAYRQARDFKQAALSYREAITTFRGAGERARSTEGLVSLAVLRLYEGKANAAIPLLLDAAEGLDPREHQDLFVTTYLNLILAFAEVGEIEAAAEMLEKVSPLRATRPKDLRFTRLRWTEGRLAVRQQRFRHAIRCFEEVQEEFRRRAMPYDVALCALDLAKLYQELGWTAEVKALARQSMPFFRAQRIHREAREAFELWANAAQRDEATRELTVATIAEIERTRSLPAARKARKSKS